MAGYAGRTGLTPHMRLLPVLFRPLAGVLRTGARLGGIAFGHRQLLRMPGALALVPPPPRKLLCYALLVLGWSILVGIRLSVCRSAAGIGCGAIAHGFASALAPQPVPSAISIISGLLRVHSSSACRPPSPPPPRGGTSPVSSPPATRTQPSLPLRSACCNRSCRAAARPPRRACGHYCENPPNAHNCLILWA